MISTDQDVNEYIKEYIRDNLTIEVIENMLVTQQPSEYLLTVGLRFIDEHEVFSSDVIRVTNDNFLK
tara:strand:+ start:1507 stop:1707 length:201 start_codon:yes stop_codon:yes gene_type:complete